MREGKNRTRGAASYDLGKPILTVSQIRTAPGERLVCWGTVLNDITLSRASSMKTG